jgi:hypothetical protein
MRWKYWHCSTEDFWEEILVLTKTLDKVRQRYSWLYSTSGVDRWCQQYNKYAVSWGPRTRSRESDAPVFRRLSLQRIATDIAGFFRRVRGKIDTSWLLWTSTLSEGEGFYAIPIKGVSTVAHTLLSQLLLPLRSLVRTAQRPRPKFRGSTVAGGVAAAANKQEMEHPSTTAVRRHGEGIREVKWGAPVEGCFIPSERLGRKAVPLSTGQQSINPWNYCHEARRYDVRERAMFSLRPVVRSSRR